MTSTSRFKKKTAFSTLSLALAAALFASPTWAQDDTQSEEAKFKEKELENEEAVDAAQDSSADLGRIVVTGSRLQRETYTSIQPLQIITAEGSREAGLVDAAEILQSSTAAGSTVTA